MTPWVVMNVAPQFILLYILYFFQFEANRDPERVGVFNLSTDCSTLTPQDDEPT
jgi:hypothetical protein